MSTGANMDGIETLSGRELDAAVAREVMGLPERSLDSCDCPSCGGELRYCGSRAWCCGAGNCGWVYAPYRSYHESVADAWQVVEHFDREDFDMRRQNGHWRATFFIPSYEFEAWGVTAPDAICRAALKLARFRAATAVPS